MTEVGGEGKDGVRMYVLRWGGCGRGMVYGEWFRQVKKFGKEDLFQRKCSIHCRCGASL